MIQKKKKKKNQTKEDKKNQIMEKFELIFFLF